MIKLIKTEHVHFNQLMLALEYIQK